MRFYPRGRWRAGPPGWGGRGGDSSESQGEDPSEVAETEEPRTDRIKLPPGEIAAISAGKQLANKVLMAKKEYPYGPRK